MQTTAYEYVFAIAKHHSISKAARELCITQPALTKYLKRLEEDLGTQLFDRAVIPISLTPAGKKFVEKAALILEIERSLQYDLNQISTDVRGKVTVGMNTEFCSNTIPYVLPEFRFRYPEIEVQIREGTTGCCLTSWNPGRSISYIPPTACPPWNLPTTSFTASRFFLQCPRIIPWQAAWTCPTTPR